MLYRVLTLLVKEILAVLRDKKARVTLILPPILQLFIFAFAATLDVKNVRIGVLNHDNGEKSIELLQRFHGSPTFSHVHYLRSNAEVHPFIDEQRGTMVISIDEQFSRNIEAGLPSNLQLILDGRKSNTAQIVAGYANQIIDQYNRDIAPRVGIHLQNTELFSRFWYNPNLIYYWYNVPCLVAILTMAIGLTITALSVAREREMGTFDQLLVSPLRPIEILLGKALPAIIIGLGEGSINLLAGIFVFQIPFQGNVAVLYIALFVFVCAIVGVGLFISSLCSTQQQAILGTFVFMSPSILLSGFATPIENMPSWLQLVTFVNPLRYMLVIVKGVFLKAMPLDIVLNNTWPMVVIAATTLSLATWLFRRQLA